MTDVTTPRPTPRAAGLLQEWDLEPDGGLVQGSTAQVIPVRTAAGEAAMLKVARDGSDDRLEALALQTWAGGGAVRLLRADPRRGALLLERAGPANLATIDDVGACEVVAGLLARIHVPAPPRFELLTAVVSRRVDGLVGTTLIPRRVTEQVVHLTGALVTDPGSVGTLLHTDLHHATVLAAEREPWLAIAPEPVSGDPHYELAPMLWHRWSEVVATGDVRAAVRRRFHTLVDVSGLDEDRARDWVVVREALEAARAARAGDADLASRHVAVLKAVQD